MSKEESVLGPEVKEAEVKDTGVTEENNVVEGEVAWSNADGGSVASIAPSVEGVSNTEGIGIRESISKQSEEEQDIKYFFPKLFIKKDELMNIEVEVVFDPYEGDIYSISQPGMLNTSILESLKVVKYTFKFSPVSYDDMQKYRKRAATYDQKSGELVINRLELRNFFLINHLKETDLVDSEGKPFELKINPETNTIALESLIEIFQTVPALLDVVLTLFERKLLILFQVSK